MISRAISFLSAVALTIFVVSAKAQVVTQTSLQLRFASLDRSFTRTNRDRRQTGSGIILRHRGELNQAGLVWQVAGYAAQNWSSSGSVTEDVFATTDDRVRSFSLLGEAFLEYSPNKNMALKVGRFQMDSLLLKSKVRALPSTFEGASLTWQPSDRFTAQATVLNKWSRRANDRFTDFETELAAPIDYVALLSAQITKNNYSLRFEALESKDYLRKFGIMFDAKLGRVADWNAELEAGAFSSRDAGNLFINGAVGALDEGEQEGRLDHHGFGYYTQLRLSKGSHRFTLARSAFNDPWLEDSYANDHGVTPFPTRTIGPELTNKNETVWLLGYRYKFKQGVLNGLSASVKSAQGYGAQNSVSIDLGRAKEHWTAFDLRYAPPKAKGLKLRLLYRDYDSDVDGEVAGVKRDRHETRLFADYTFRF